jgi:hypothetical protein
MSAPSEVNGHNHDVVIDREAAEVPSDEPPGSGVLQIWWLPSIAENAEHVATPRILGLHLVEGMVGRLIVVRASREVTGRAYG